MSAMALLSSQPWVERLGWTLLHFVWIGALIALLYSAGRRAARSARPNTRYLIACAALAAMIAAPAGTWCLLGPHVAATGAAPVAPVMAPAASAQGRSGVLIISNSPLPEPLLSWVVAIWFAGTIAFWTRLAAGWALAVRLRSVSVAPAPPVWSETLERLKTAILARRPVRLFVSSVVAVPGVVGWLRPVLLVPASTLTGLPAGQVEALLLHELAHIRRFDYLVNILQSIVEALLFYHPAVWWISNHIREERELCCDDLAVSVTGDAASYARALADLASSRAAFEAALAANGGSLSHRIARLLGRSKPDARSIGGPEVLTSAILVAALAFGLFGQTAVHRKFEVASVKPSPEQRFMMVRPLPGGRLTASAPLRLLIQNAYSLQAFQIIGGPAWIDSDRYQIEAKAEGNASRAEVFEMLQSLLEHRFHLRAHRETRMLPVYDLVAAKNGPKLPAPKEGGCVNVNPDAPPSPPRSGFPCGRGGIMAENSTVRVAGGKLGMPEFTRILSIILGRNVIDKTGFTREFDVQLDFTPDSTTAGLPNPVSPGTPGTATPTADPANPSIFSAVQEQLGLKLESAKGPVDVLVIDSVARPAGN